MRIQKTVVLAVTARRLLDTELAAPPPAMPTISTLPKPTLPHLPAIPTTIARPTIHMKLSTLTRRLHCFKRPHVESKLGRLI